MTRKSYTNPHGTHATQELVTDLERALKEAEEQLAQAQEHRSFTMEGGSVLRNATHGESPDQQDTMRLAYAEFSKDETGGTVKRDGISALRLYKVLEKMGEKMTHVAIDQMIHYGDRNNTGRLSFEEFREVITTCSSTDPSASPRSPSQKRGPEKCAPPEGDGHMPTMNVGVSPDRVGSSDSLDQM